uniref:MYND-type domain-containing protein n=2 Tax=Wuchereria bancrofti TaxID=6293 RepID=A0AAF5RSX9_WUCBA
MITNAKAPDNIYQRIRYFDEPFAYICLNYQVEKYCSHCLRKPDNGKLYKCAKCELARYCNKECQRLAWKKHHRAECERLKMVYPNLPLSEVLFLSRIIDRILLLEQYGDKHKWEKSRKWSDLMGHENDIRNDKLRYAHFEKIYEKMAIFRKDEMIEKEKFYEIFCKTTINSHSIHTNAGDEIGLALDLGVSAYDHSCRPNCSLVFDGFHAYLRPLTSETNAFDLHVARISYIDIGCSRYQRQKQLKSKWYFDCQCDRCMDQSDIILTSIRCKNELCDEALIITEISEPIDIKCTKCMQITDANHIKKCQQLMLNLPIQFDINCSTENLKEKLNEAMKYLHTKNVYVTRLKAALLHFTGTLNDNLLLIQKSVYENYRLCFPRSDRHLAYQLLKIAKSLIEKGERKEAVPYAYEAMSIFEVCFGLNHPYYLQTLALWTFLDQKITKTNDELFALMNFQSNKPVDLSEFLSKKV